MAAILILIFQRKVLFFNVIVALFFDDCKHLNLKKEQPKFLERPTFWIFFWTEKFEIIRIKLIKSLYQIWTRYNYAKMAKIRFIRGVFSTSAGTVRKWSWSVCSVLHIFLYGIFHNILTLFSTLQFPCCPFCKFHMTIAHELYDSFTFCSKN